jgi:acyl-CoA thioesterase
LLIYITGNTAYKKTKKKTYRIWNLVQQFHTVAIKSKDITKKKKKKKTNETWFKRKKKTPSNLQINANALLIKYFRTFSLMFN